MREAGLGGTAAIYPTEMAFGEQRVGTTNSGQVLVVNTGTSPLEITSFSIPEPFGVYSASGSFTVAAGASLELYVTFHPTVEGSATGTLTLYTDDPSTPTLSVALTGTGVKPTMALSPTVLDFGEQRVGTSGIRTVNVTNIGTGTLVVSSVSITGSTSFTVSPTSFSVPAGNSVTLSVKFSPTVEAAATGTLTLSTNDPGTPTTSIALTGNGVKPTLVLSPSSLSFGDVRVNTSMTRTVTVANTGTGTLSISNMSITGASFTVSPSGPLSVPANASRQLSVTFSPTAQGAVTGTLTLTTNDAVTPSAVINLEGTGVKPVLELLPNPLVFGDVRVGTTVTMPVTVRNTGTGPITLTGITKSGDAAFTLVSPPSTPFTLASSTSQTFTVRFSPTVETNATGTVTLTTDDPDYLTVVVNVSGKGVKPNLVVEPNPLAFSDVRVGTSVTKTVMVSNPGSGPITLTNLIMSGSTDFSLVTPPSVPFTLVPGASQIFTVKFSSTAEAVMSGALVLSTTDSEFASVSINLSGRGVKPNLVLSPSSLAFSDQRVGTSATRTVTVSNTGTGPIVFTGISTGTGSAFSLVSPPSMPFTLAASSSQTFTVRFSPTAEAVATSTLTLTTSDPDWSNLSVALSGAGVKPNLVVSPSSHSFGEQSVGSTSAAQTVTVMNTGTGTVRITGISITAGKPFAVSTSTAFDLAAGASKDLSVTFSPTTKGDVTATLSLSTDDAATSVVSVSLFGNGVSSLAMSPVGSLDFGEVPKGPAVKRTVTLSNTSGAPIQLTSMSALSAPFSVSGITLPVMLAPGSATTFEVNFSPTDAQSYSAVLVVQSDATNSPHTLVLKGTGTVPEARLSLPASDGVPIASLDFGGVRGGSTKQMTVRLINVGKAPLVLSEPPTVTGSAFAYLGQSAVSLPPGAYIDFPVSFAPTSSASYSGTLTFKSNAVNSPTVLSLTGFGAVPQLTPDRTSISFGDVRVGSQSVTVPITLNNTGNADVTLQGLTVDGPFSVVLPSGVSLPRTIPALSSFTFEAFFKPTVQGAVAGSISIISDTDSSPLKVTLSGSGTVARISLSVASLDFGAQRVMSTSGTQPVVITNTGSAELEITQFVFTNSAFSISSPLPLPTESAPLKIAAAQQKAVFLTFTPSTPGAAVGQLHIVSNSASAVEPLSLKGKGIDGRMSLTPATVSFPGVEVGSSGTKMTVMLTNVGEAPLALSGVTTPAEAAFSISGLPAGTVLQPGEGWPFTVAFAPVKRGYVSTSVVIKSDAVTVPSINLSMEGTGVAAAVEVLPTDLVFGQSNVGVAITREIAIKNVGEKDLYVSNIAFEDAASGATGAALDFSVGDSVVFPLVLPPGTSTLVSLKFSARQVGLRQARALVYTNDRTAEVNLQGEGTSPSLQLSTSMLDFGRVLVGSPSAPRVLKLSNLGSGPLTLTAMRLSGADAASFVLSVPTLPVTLSRGTSTEVFVAMRPEVERSFSALLVVESNDASASSVAVPLTGTGVRQQIQLSVSSLEFGHQLINATSSPRKLRVINNSESNVTLTALTVQGSGASQFSLGAPALPLSLAPGQEQEVAVSFTPQAEAETSCTLKLSFSELSQPLEAALHGQGIPSVLAINPSPLDFGSVRVGGAKREQPLTVTNLSSDPIVLAAVEVTYSTGEPFTYDAASVQGRTLEPGASLIVPVGYQPMVESLSETTLSFGTTVPARPRAKDVQLKGWATKRFLTVDPESLAFGRVDVDVPVEPKAVTVTNRSSQTQRVVVKLRDAEGTPFSVQTSALSEPLAAGATATFKVAFQPQTAGDSQNEVQVWLQGATEPDAVIPVTGSAFSSTEEPAGCSCGTTDVGSSGLMALLVMVGLGSRRRRRA